MKSEAEPGDWGGGAARTDEEAALGSGETVQRAMRVGARGRTGCGVRSCVRDGAVPLFYNVRDAGSGMASAARWSGGRTREHGHHRLSFNIVEIYTKY